ncbi:MAG: deoxyribose-phosphate aldolase [Chloroflexi bacterium]|nr:deoxyribose-phosphate aldolase [Chloroflexota bacterium]
MKSQPLPLGKQLGVVARRTLRELGELPSEIEPAILSAKKLAAMIDHTQLKAEADRAMITQLCDEARQYGFASVCVNPYNVALCADLLKDTKVKVCSVTGFALGASRTRVKVAEAKLAIADGASEIDMVMNIGALKDGDYRIVRNDIRDVANACHAQGALLKVILETCLLSEQEKVMACLLAQDAGADFVKTSTGLNMAGATVADIALMSAVCGDRLGIKAAGKVRSLATALRMVAAGATRIGATASVSIMQEAQ